MDGLPSLPYRNKVVYLPCDRIHTVWIIRHGPCYTGPIFLRYVVDMVEHGGKLNGRQTSVAVAIYEDAGLLQGRRCGLRQSQEQTYPFQVSMDDLVRMKIAETFSNI